MIDSQSELELIKLNSAAPLVRLDTLRPRGGPSANAGPSLAHLIRILQRQKWKLMGFIALAMMAAIMLQFTLTKLYEATAELKVDRHSAPGVLGQEAAQVSAVDDMDQVLTTQVVLAQSDLVLRPVAERFRLLSMEHQLNGLNAVQIARKGGAPIELKRLKVARPPNTYLINISYRAASPQLAAEVANAVAQSLVENSKRSANRPYAEVSALIEKHMVDLRAKMDAASQREVQYEKDLNMIDSKQHTTILSARLEQLNAELTVAQTDRLRKEAVMNEVAETHTLAAARAAESDTQHSLLIDALQRVEVARQEFAAAKSYYGENHPAFLKAKQQLDEAVAQVDAERSGTNDKTIADYEQALHREKKLQGMVDETKGSVDRQQQMLSQYELLKSENELDKTTYDDLAKRNSESDVNDHFRDATVQLVSEARPPYDPIFPKLAVNLPIAFILSAILGILGVVFADSLDNTFSDPEEVASKLNVDVLASVPVVRRLPPVRMGDGLVPLETEGRNAEMTALYGEAIRILRNTISLTSLDKPIHTLLMTSANPAEGKSTTSVHLALSCAQIGKKVLLIDADMRRPTIHKQFGVSGETGLSEILTRGIPFGDAMVQIDDTSLYVLPAGPPSQHASDLISIGFASVLARVARDFDLVIIDGPPMLGLSETQEIASMVDGVLLVTKAGSTTGKALADSMSGMLRVRAHVLGIVMNQVKSSHAGYGYGYGYGYRPLAGKKSSEKA